jgi:hypothetical protein
MVEVDGYIEESSPKGYEERSIPVPEFILEQLSIHVEGKTPADQVFASSKSGSVLRNRTFRRGWFNIAAEQSRAEQSRAEQSRAEQSRADRHLGAHLAREWAHLRASSSVDRPCPAER